MKTSEEILENHKPSEIMQSLQLERYRRDYPVFAEEILKVTPKYVTETGLVPFRLNKAQRYIESVAQAMQNRDGWIRLCILKSRQPGVSTWSSGRGYQLVALTPHTHGYIFAHDDDTAEHVLNMVRRYYDNTIDQYKPGVYSRPAGGLIFIDPASPPGYKERRIGSSIYCQTAKTTLSGTGHTLQFVQLSECSKYTDPASLWSSLLPAIPDVRGTTVILESTAYFTGKWFRDKYDMAKNDPDFPYQAIFTPWYFDTDCQLALQPDERLVLTLEEKQRKKEYGLTSEQIKWYRYKLRQYGNDDVAAEMMKQDYPETDEEAWINVTLSVFDRRKLLGILADQVRPPERVCNIIPNGRLLDDPEGLLSVWEMPIPGEIYDIGADVASGETGDEFDWSVASVVKRRSREQVAEWRGKGVDPIDYAKLVRHLGLRYNRAQVAVEVTGIGYSTNTQLQKLNYPNVYFWRTRGEATEKLTRYTGWRTTSESKPFMVSMLRHYIMNDGITIRSKILHEEMKLYTQNVTDAGNVQYGAPPGANDDAIDAYMIAVIIGDDERVGPEFVSDQEERKSRPFVDPALVEIYDEVSRRYPGAMQQLSDMLSGAD